MVEALNEDSKSLKGSRVLVLGLSYKANIDDTRESPSYELIELLAEGGARVDYCDAFFPEAPRTRKHDLGLKSVPCTAEVFAGFDAVLVATAHDQFKDPRLWRGVKLVVDTRNMVGPLFGEGVATGRGRRAPRERKSAPQKGRRQRRRRSRRRTTPRRQRNGRLRQSSTSLSRGNRMRSPSRMP